MEATPADGSPSRLRPGRPGQPTDERDAGAHRHAPPGQQQRERQARNTPGQVRTGELGRGYVHKTGHRQCHRLAGEQRAGRARHERERHRAPVGRRPGGDQHSARVGCIGQAEHKREAHHHDKSGDTREAQSARFNRLIIRRPDSQPAENRRGCAAVGAIRFAEVGLTYASSAIDAWKRAQDPTGGGGGGGRVVLGCFDWDACDLACAGGRI